jgi:hypothetical protein
VLKIVGGGSSGLAKRRPGLKLEMVPDIILDFEPLRQYYDYNIDFNIEKSQDGEGQLLGSGADKMVYKIETNLGPKAEVRFKSSMKTYNAKMVYKHLEVLKRYLATGPHSFIIPKLYKYARSDNPVEMIMDLVPSACLKRNKKLNDDAVIRDFLAFCANVGVEPVDVEYCVDDDGKVYFYDFGNIIIDKKR